MGTKTGASRKGNSTRLVAVHKAGRSKRGRRATETELQAIREGRERAKRRDFLLRHSSL